MGRNIYEDALLVQDACNLKGVTNSLAELARDLPQDSNGICQHPAIILFIDKLYDMVGRPDLDAYCKASAKCKSRAGTLETLEAS